MFATAAMLSIYLSFRNVQWVLDSIHFLSIPLPLPMLVFIVLSSCSTVASFIQRDCKGIWHCILHISRHSLQLFNVVVNVFLPPNMSHVSCSYVELGHCISYYIACRWWCWCCFCSLQPTALPHVHIRSRHTLTRTQTHTNSSTYFCLKFLNNIVHVFLSFQS